MRFLSRYSFVLITLIAVTATAGYAIWRAETVVGMAAVILAAFLSIFWVAARRGGAVVANPERRIQRLRGGGRPLVVHFFSDYSLRCLVQRLVAAPAERAFRGRCEFVYVDVNQAAAYPVLESLGANLGDFVLFDEQGNLAGKTGWLTRQRLAELCAQRAR
ncbi:MAG TPA: hypothetical protein VIL07_05435 [Symbiobacteriaceae bacterium]